MPTHNFDQSLTQWQVAWREKNLECQEWGEQNGRRYPWILPDGHWEESLWPAIRTAADYPVSNYLEATGVQHHDGVHNLKSSWVQCANLYFAFGQTESGRDLLAGFLRAHVGPEITTVDRMELEYAEEGDLHPSKLLGEAGGKRGAGQTSPDVAFIVNGGEGLVLMENKLVEHSFYNCSALRTWGSDKKPGNPDPTRCSHVAEILRHPHTHCHQLAWGRKYWDILLPAADRDALLKLRSCPAANGGYQLFRQQALAEGIAQSGKYDFVISCVALDARNDAIRVCMRGTGLEDVRQGWANLFNGRARFTTFAHQQWVAWVRDHDTNGLRKDWSEYVAARYAY